jgi:pyruvate/2-oxoglutarate dehydrogenase complex dihydrolipoamide dehydrogenase (E3) component
MAKPVHSGVLMASKGAGTYNVVVIGAGTAGLVTAAGTASLGGRVALIERHKMGGDCLNFGCVPSKALISSARLAHNIRHAGEWGLEEQKPQLDLQKVMERMRSRRAAIAPNDSQERFESLGADVFRGEAHFTSPHEVEINGTKLRAKNFVIASGTRAAIPPIDGLADVPYFTNETIFDELKETPASMIVIGGGPIGCELAQAFCRLGVKVTILNRGAQILPKEDPEVAALIRERLEREGITIITEAQARSDTRSHGLIDLTYTTKAASENKQTLSAEALLIASGRTPNLEQLNLEAARVRHSEKGIETNARLQTSQSHIYAVGDIAGPYQFTHMADYQARVVVRNILLPFRFCGSRSITPLSPGARLSIRRLPASA